MNYIRRLVYYLGLVLLVLIVFYLLYKTKNRELHDINFILEYTVTCAILLFGWSL